MFAYDHIVFLTNAELTKFGMNLKLFTCVKSPEKSFINLPERKK